MAGTGRIISSAYRKNQNDLKTAGGKPATQGVSINLPSALCMLKPAPANTVANGVTMQTIIELLPTGLQRNGQSDQYYSADTVAAIQSAST